MRPITYADLLPPAEYVRARDLWVRELIAHKKSRRVPLGELVTAVFEDRKTVLFQIHEMIRAEHIQRREAIQHEIDTYNAILPGAGELSATLLVDITDRARIRAELDRLVGLHEHTYLKVGDLEPVRATFDEAQLGEQRISAVQYTKIPVRGAVAAAFADPAVPAALVIDHPAYRVEGPLAGEVRASLVRDLAAA